MIIKNCHYNFKNKSYLLNLKKNLRKLLQNSILCDSKSFTREVEEKFFEIYNGNVQIEFCEL